MWVASLAAKGGFSVLAAAGGMHADVRPIPLSTGVSLLGDTLILGVQALSTGLPFSPDQRRERRNTTWVDRLLAAARAARPVDPPADGQLHHSPTLCEGMA